MNPKVPQAAVEWGICGVEHRLQAKFGLFDLEAFVS